MNDKLGFLLFAGVVFFVSILFGTLTYQEQKRNETIELMAAKGVNPILARCSIDASYSSNNVALCAEALRKEAK
jgi:hypothetical protein